MAQHCRDFSVAVQTPHQDHLQYHPQKRTKSVAGQAQAEDGRATWRSDGPAWDGWRGGESSRRDCVEVATAAAWAASSINRSDGDWSQRASDLVRGMMKCGEEEEQWWWGWRRMAVGVEGDKEERWVFVVVPNWMTRD